MIFPGKKVNGGAAISYALLIFFVAVAVIAGITLLYSFHEKSHIRLDWQDRVIHNTDSGLELLMAEGFDTEGDWVAIDLFDDERDSIRVKTMDWGIFRIGLCESTVRQYHEKKAILIGQSPDIRYSLYLPDLNQGISITGETRLEGRIYIPKKGLKRANIEGKNYLGDRMVYGAMNTSERAMKTINTKALDKAFLYEPGESDSIVFADRLFSEDIRQPFFDPTVVIEGDYLDLFEAHLSGNCKIYARGDVTISKDNTLENIILYARKVYIEDGFKGNLQIFARDSIFVGEDVVLNYPSALYSENLTDTAGSYISIGKNSRVSGELVTYKKNVGRKYWPKIVLGDGCIFQGLIYSSGFAEIRGIVAGSVTALKLFYKGRSGTYENTLVDAVISETRISEKFLSGLVFESKDQKQIIRYLK